MSDRNRSLISYVRGAFKREADDATGEVSTAYLRTGATWSGSPSPSTTAPVPAPAVIRLLHPRGSNAADALSSLFVIADGGILDLLALARFVENGEHSPTAGGASGLVHLPDLRRFRQQTAAPARNRL